MEASKGAQKGHTTRAKKARDKMADALKESEALREFSPMMAPYSPSGVALSRLPPCTAKPFVPFGSDKGGPRVAGKEATD